MYLNKVNVTSGSTPTKELERGQSSGVDLASNISSVSQKKRRPKLGLSLNFPKAREEGALLGAGLCGEVRRDIDHDGFVLKDISRFPKNLAQEECSLFQRVYGEGAAEVVEKEHGVYLRMLEVPGKTLDKCEPSELPVNARDLFLQMISDLNDVGIIHGDLHSGNIMYDKDSNRFWPIDLSNAYDSYYNNPIEYRAFMDIDNEKRFQNIMSKLSNSA
ncbi:hypothetical protein V6560_004419 [Vibrio parahaemolyticus]